MSCRGTVAKVTLCVVNVVSLVFGLGLMWLGYRVHQATADAHLSTNLVLGLVTWRALFVGLVVAGAVFAAVALMGLCATVFDSAHCLITAYVYTLALCAAAVVVANVAFWFMGDELTDQAAMYFHRLAVNATHDHDSNAMDAIQSVQMVAMCCGERNYDDWHNRTWLAGDAEPHGLNDSHVTRAPVLPSPGLYPLSCCDMKWWSDSVKSTESPTIDAPTQAPNTAAGMNGGTVDSKQNVSTKSESKATTLQSSTVGPTTKQSTPVSNMQQCTASKVVYMDGCFSPAQVDRYQLFGQDLFLVVLFVLLLLLVLSSCLDRDRRLEASKLINLQYAAHLQVCGGGPRG